jgi:hypothetical protein
VPNGDDVFADDDFLDEQCDDALALHHVHVLHLHAQTLDEFAQSVSEPWVGGFIGELGTRGFEFRLQRPPSIFAACWVQAVLW